MALLSFRKVPSVCPKCKHHKLVREPRGPMLRLVPRAEKYGCHYCDTIVVRVMKFLTLTL